MERWALLYSVNTWGFITLRHIGTKPGALSEPLQRTFRPLTDASWSSDTPVCLESLAPECTLILAHRADGLVLPSLRRSRKGALPSQPVTSKMQTPTSHAAMGGEGLAKQC